MAREEARRTWRQLTADAAASHLAAWKRSGATLSEYARSVGLSYQRLHRWRLRLEASGAAQQPAFLPVRILEAEPAAVHERASGLEVLAPGGLRIVVPPDFDASVLERLLRAVRRASC